MKNSKFVQVEEKDSFDVKLIKEYIKTNSLVYIYIISELFGAYQKKIPI